METTKSFLMWRGAFFLVSLAVLSHALPQQDALVCSNLKSSFDCELNLACCFSDASSCLPRSSSHCPTPTTTRTQSSPKTNFVLLLADDLGYGDVSLYQQGNKPTPNLLKLAQEGALFTNFHSGSSICSPSRAAMLSGLFPDRTCVSGINVKDIFQLHPSTSTIAHDLKLAGYTSLFLGKWHLSHQLESISSVFGFDQRLASYGSLLTYDTACMCQDVLCHQAGDSCPASAGCVPLKKHCVQRRNPCDMGPINVKEFQTTRWPELFECSLNNGSVFDLPRNRLTCDILVDEFERFVSRQAWGNPFLAVINFYESHRPVVADPTKRKVCEAGSLTCTTNAQKLKPNSLMSHYYSIVESLDEAVGRVKNILVQAEIANHTLILFSSDNGPETKKLGGAGSAGKLRGRKRSLWEGGHRVPGFIHWPRGISTPFVFHGLVSILDIRPTIRAIVTKESADHQLFYDDNNALELDGESLLPLLDHPNEWQRTKGILVCNPLVVDSLLKKYPIPQRVCDKYAFYHKNYKMIATRNFEFTFPRYLFDMSRDFRESKNLALVQEETFAELVAQASPTLLSVLENYSVHCNTSIDVVYV